MAGILITGATGSCGSAIVRKLLTTGWLRICIFSRDELKQSELRRALNDDKRLRFFIGCVRDQERLRRAFEGVHTVIHTAALKRVEVGTYDASEMVKTNVLGTMNLIEAAHDAGVRKVLAVSTDKACRPPSAYGASKLMMEKLILAANNATGHYGPRFAVARFGNFLGSRGSVIPTWLSCEGPVPITDPDCTRFFITPEDAAEVILEAAETMQGGEVVMPKLKAFRLGDLAEALGLETRIVGLGAEEQKHEFMQDSSEFAEKLTVEELRGIVSRYRKT